MGAYRGDRWRSRLIVNCVQLNTETILQIGIVPHQDDALADIGCENTLRQRDVPTEWIDPKGTVANLLFQRLSIKEVHSHIWFGIMGLVLIRELVDLLLEPIFSSTNFLTYENDYFLSNYNM